MSGRRLLAAGMAALAALALAPAQARPLAAIKERGRIVLCANPNALPHAARDAERPGIQIELARALADQLGVGLEIGWVVFGYHLRRVDCDIILDSIADPEAQAERRVRLSRPYHQSGVVLAFRPGVAPVASYRDLTRTQRIGAMSSSFARVYLGQRDIPTIPFTFEDEMVEALGKGEIDVAVVTPGAVGYYNLIHPDATLTATPAFASVPELNWTVAVGMRKADDALIESINAALDRLIEDGTVRRIYGSYGVELRPPAR